ncbi:uncharacterized protein PY17X_1051501 [Plasmodium yoelii]|uniref:PIR protein n=2 Tax=Plasmodium yoelii TaxID=5861 RepID=A0AAE9WXF2_PLAYO|nr:uncharacterized protein PY17X_1051501 [Plasmodium yoelii]WBY58322.1 PIR protein [Plasmodium yoelii yoelii]CDS44421.1 YIR protein [Plasmodium yoelii]VTZ79239.1 PIR protein [Plasmodium yoelii]|eukprot:XP_730051.2 uncharacterized protein PY17X_1051501 [Plasmodium yoelii]
MNKEVCKRFQNVRDLLSDELTSSGSYNFKDGELLNNYCDSNQCQSEFDRISAGCLYLLYQFYNDDGMFPSPKNSNPYIVDYILIWLSYMLNLYKTNEYDSIKNFYNDYIKNGHNYNKETNELIGYLNYKGLIDARNNLLYMDSNIVSEFYEAFKLLCNMYNELDDEKIKCKKYLEDNNEFDKKYKELNQNTSITKNDSYNKLLSTLLIDYNDFKKVCNDTSSSTSKETEHTPGKTLGQDYGLYSGQESGQESGHESELYSGLESGPNFESISEATSSSSSITSKLIPVLLILGAIPIFLGIAYKYSLFGFRKRVQKHLREKLKK